MQQLVSSFIAYSPISISTPISCMNESCIGLALIGFSVEGFLFTMGSAVNRDNRELLLSDFALCACEYEFQLHEVVCSR